MSVASELRKISPLPRIAHSAHLWVGTMTIMNLGDLESTNMSVNNLMVVAASSGETCERLVLVKTDNRQLSSLKLTTNKSATANHNNWQTSEIP